MGLFISAQVVQALWVYVICLFYIRAGVILVKFFLLGHRWLLNCMQPYSGLVDIVSQWLEMDGYLTICTI